MNDLSIIIVNYNVRYFLRQCIQSIYDSDCNCSFEVHVVDNESSDGSVEMLKEDYPEVKLISNRKNLGFSKANNQAIELIDSKYCLILNPDTLLRKDCLQKCVDYYHDNPDVGALGVKLIDGNGNYLPESKRGLPTPWVAFCKFSGLSKLFARSKFFNGYYMGHLSRDQTNDVQVLTGAFMMIPTDLLISLSGFDERFFMYGEDIDLSYRISKSGKRVVYLADTSIIHYKGESTKKSSINYVKHFYHAMILFADKHYLGSKRSGFLSFMKLGIYVSAIVSSLRNLFRTQVRILVDLFLIIFTMLGFSNFWASVYFKDPEYYSEIPLIFYLTIFSIIWLVISFVFGHYDEKPSWRKYALGIFFSALGVILVYSLFPESWRFSRFLLLSLIPIASLILWLTKKIWNKGKYNSWKFIPLKDKRFFIVGSADSCRQVSKLIMNQMGTAEIVGFVKPEGVLNTEEYVASLSELNEASRIHNINEVIFCSKEIDTEKIFYWMTKLGRAYSFKIASKDNESILGSDSKHRMGKWYTLEVNYRITDQTRMRFKRILDIIIAILILILSPILIFKKGAVFMQSILKVLVAKRTMVSYNMEDDHLDQLPALKAGIFNTSKLSNLNVLDKEDIHQLNLYYAKNYAIWQDLDLIWKNILV